MLFVLALVVFVVLMYLSRGQWYVGKGELNLNTFIRNLAKYFSMTLAGALVVTFLVEAFVLVPAGYRGVVFHKLSGKVGSTSKEGLNFIVPFIQEVILFEIRTQKLESEATAASKDLQSVHARVALNIHPLPDRVGDLYQTVGIDYENRIILPAVQEAVKAVTAKYTAEELITKREDVKHNISELLMLKLRPQHIELMDIFITNFEFGKEFSAAIESKQIAEQQALKAKRDLDRVKIEAEQKIAQARAEAESLRMQKEAITPNLIQLRGIEVQAKAIEKWDGKLPEIMMGGSMPFIDMGKFIKGGNKE